MADVVLLCVCVCVSEVRHEEDMYQQQSEARETRRQCERSCKVSTCGSTLHLVTGSELVQVAFVHQNTCI